MIDYDLYIGGATVTNSKAGWRKGWIKGRRRGTVVHVL